MRTDLLEKKELILELIKDGKPKAEICRILKCKEVTLNSYLVKMNIEYIGNQGRKGSSHGEQRKPAIFYIKNKINISSHKLKLKLIEDGLKEYRCESCKLNEWMGVTIPIELHHIDGNRFNNDIDNLQILCPNCHAITDNYSGKKK